MIQALLPLLLILCAAPVRAAAEQVSGDTLVLTNASVVPMTGEGILRDRTIVVAGGEIVAIRPAGTKRVPAGAEVRDLSGRYVLPGLIDAHVHLREPDRSLVLYPANGVTTVVNLEGEPRHLALGDSILISEAVAPRVLSSGPFLEEVAESPQEVRREVRRQHAAGYDLIKIHGDMAEEAFAAAIDEATRLGLPVVGHRPENIPTETVLQSGMAALAHAEELLGSSLLWEPAGLDADSARAIGEAIAESGIAVITTLAFFTAMRDQATDRFHEMIADPALAYVSPERRHAWLYEGHREYIDASEIPWYDAAVADLHRITHAVREQGGTIIAGTDTPLEFAIPGFSLIDELERLAVAGLTPLEALRAATTAPADLLGRTELGRIEPGAAADLLVLGSDPTISLEGIGQLNAVVLRGRWLSRAELDSRLDALAAAYAREEVERAARERLRHGIVALVREKGAEAAADEITRLAEASGTPRLDEPDLNSLGYSLLSAGDIESAIGVFRLNVRLHPLSANAYDSLGEGLLRAGRLDEAERNYERALELDATMDSARRGLREIVTRRGGTG